MSLVNIWHLRQVAEASAKPCDICFKPTTAVLITPDKQDYFYVCQTHVKDRGFCSPIIDEAEVAAKKKKEDMDRELALIQKQYEERLRQASKDSKEKEKEKEKEKGKDKEKKDGENADHEEDKAEKEKNDKIRAATPQSVAPAVDEIPRVYALQKVFYQKRLDRKRNAEIAKRDRERLNTLKNPTLFPSVPGNTP